LSSAGAQLLAEYAAQPSAFAGELPDAAPELLADALDSADRRRGDRPPPVYVTGVGMTAPTLVAALLAGVDGLRHVGQVRVPPVLRRRLHGLAVPEQAFVVDGLHLLHTGRPLDAVSQRFVNSGADVADISRYRLWDAGCGVVHAYRDPRDDVAEHLAGDDLRRWTLPAARSYAAYRESDHKADVEVAYEAVLDDPGPQLRRLLHVLGVAGGDHAADPGVNVTTPAPAGRSVATPTQQQRRRLHVDLRDVTAGLGYPLDDCVGSPLPALEQSPPRALDGLVLAAVGALDLRTGDAGPWQPQPASRGVVHVPAGAAVRLRVGRLDTATLQALAALGPDDVDALCLAGVAGVGDQAATLIARLRGLRELDLAATAVTDRGLAQLTRLGRLVAVSIVDTAVTGAGIAWFTQQMPSCLVGGPAS
jgi:hypothetical protein